MDTKSYNIRVPKRWARITMIVGVTALIAAPLTAVATHTFNDVPDTHTFHADIEWLEESGVTKGCNPPANTLFCPDDNVTRGQMAAFMERFAGYLGAKDGTPAQADNATTADSATTADVAALAEGVATDVAGVALAGVTVNSNGTLLSWFNRLGGTPSVSQTGTGLYDITIPGANIPTNASEVNQQATPRTTVARTVSVSGIDGDARVRLFDSAGTLTNTPFTYVLIGPLSQVAGAASSTATDDPEHLED